MSSNNTDSFEVIAEFGKEPVEEYFIEYFDGSEWISAVGKWNEAISIQHSYNNEGIATKLAETLFKLEKQRFRVIKEKDV